MLKITHFLSDIIDADLASGKVKHVHTRFPPEPNGCLHIGSAKAIWINWSMAKQYNGTFNLRFDDTNPAKENEDFVRSIERDIVWLTGEQPNGGIFYGSDYFQSCFDFALKLIKQGDAYVCALSQDELRLYRGTLTEPGKNSPWRERPVEESLDLFLRMKNGEFEDGTYTLRAKIDMSSPNMNMRDPAIFRIAHVPHFRQGDKWCVYPLYDYAHPIQDALEGITHSMCSLEFENNRPLYDWVVDKIGFDPAPHQYEFARLNVSNTVMSKRYLRKLVETGLVDGWDDPRMPTLSGLRRRGYTPSMILDFIARAGVSKANSLVDIKLLEHCAREALGTQAERRTAILEPLPVLITNLPDAHTESFSFPNHPDKPELGLRDLTFTRNIFIEREDFSENPPPKFHRLKPGGEVRLMGAYIIRCDKVVKNHDGSINHLECSADLETHNGMPSDGRKIKGTVHWLAAESCIPATVRLYSNLFSKADMNDIPEGGDYGDYLNPDSLIVRENAVVEPSLAACSSDDTFQFVRHGYFHADLSSTPDKPLFNRVVALKETK